ncbi:hypothetical protein JCM8202_003055 [Rhodotorula sphaerocarpa]
MASARPPPEVLSVAAPAASLSAHRVFVSLSVLLVFLLIAYFKPDRTPRNKPVAVRAAGKRNTKTVLLVGPLAAGKTALFSKLVYGHVQPSYTSMKENEAVVSTKWTPGAPSSEDKHELVDEKLRLETPVHLVDIPGHPRLRTRSLAQYLPAADGIVFTIDGAAGLTGKHVRDAAEHLHVLLSLFALHSARQPNLPPLLILLTKSDLSGSSAASAAGTSSPSAASKSRSPALTLERAKQSLLRELERRRLASTGAGGSNSTRDGAASSSHGSVPLSAGARLEGLDAIPSSGSRSRSGFVPWLLSCLGLGDAAGTGGALSSSGGGERSSSALSSATAGLPSDENEILSAAAEDVFAFEGTADWDKLAAAVGGVAIQWKTSSAPAAAAGGTTTTTKGGDVEGVYEWVEAL